MPSYMPWSFAVGPAAWTTRRDARGIVRIGLDEREETPRGAGATRAEGATPRRAVVDSISREETRVVAMRAGEGARRSVAEERRRSFRKSARSRDAAFARFFFSVRAVGRTFGSRGARSGAIESARDARPRRAHGWRREAGAPGRAHDSREHAARRCPAARTTITATWMRGASRLPGDAPPATRGARCPARPRTTTPRQRSVGVPVHGRRLRGERRV